MSFFLLPASLPPSNPYPSLPHLILFLFLFCPPSLSPSLPSSHPPQGWQTNVRGAGILFGRPLVERFLQMTGVQVVVRSHQMVEAGWEAHYDGQLLTVFSASHYGGSNENAGLALLPSPPPPPLS